MVGFENFVGPEGLYFSDLRVHTVCGTLVHNDYLYSHLEKCDK
jgi:hypothetical protein